jgi:hypothetical protein
VISCFVEMSNEEVQSENMEVEVQIKQLRSRMALLKELSRTLETQYASSKMYQPWARYQLLKSMIRTTLNDDAVKTNLLATFAKQHHRLSASL